MVEQAPDRLSEWQRYAMAVPESFDLALTGGRGGGKTRLLAALFLRHCEQHGANARCLVVRKSFPGLADLESELIAFLTAVYGHRGFEHNRQSHRFTLPNGGTIQLDQLESEKDFGKFQGKGFSYIAVDEAGQYASPALVDRLRSSLRAQQGIPLRFLLLANPGGAGHHWIAQRHAMRQGWVPYTDEQTGAAFVTAPSTYRDNDFIDQEAYRRNLLASCATDPELGHAWLDGDWSVLRGAYFAGVIHQDQVMIDPWHALPLSRADTRPQLAKHDRSLVENWHFYLAHDFGVSAPSVTYLCALSPGDIGPDGRFYPADSVVLIDEDAEVHKEDENAGLGLTVPDQAERILDMCRAYGAHPSGVADDAIFNSTGSQAGTIAEEFRRAGVYFKRARKGSRQAGWEKMRRMLADAGKPDVPGLYVSSACRYWWRTVPSLPRDTRRPEDLDTTAPDHAADATRYALRSDPRPIRTPMKWVV